MQLTPGVFAVPGVATTLSAVVSFPCSSTSNLRQHTCGGMRLSVLWMGSKFNHDIVVFMSHLTVWCPEINNLRPHFAMQDPTSKQPEACKSASLDTSKLRSSRAAHLGRPRPQLHTTQGVSQPASSIKHPEWPSKLELVNSSQRTILAIHAA